MKFLEKFKRKQKPIPKKEKPIQKRKIEKKPEEKKVEPKDKKVQERKPATRAYRVLKEPHITEKATDSAKKNQYIFKVYPRANKTEIKMAVESLYGVEVTLVRIIKIPSKRRRLGRTEGWRKGCKKAIVKIKKGQTIELLPR